MVEKKAINISLMEQRIGLLTHPEPEYVCCLRCKMQSKVVRELLAFVHPMDLKGISVGKPEDKMGIRASPTASITYDQVELNEGSSAWC